MGVRYNRSMAANEYDFDAMAEAIAQGRAPRALPDLLRGLYELGVRHGEGWCEPDLDVLRALAETASIREPLSAPDKRSD